MFKHPSDPSTPNAPGLAEPKNSSPPSVEKKINTPSSQPLSAGEQWGLLKDLLEKNLKWSQIIYEQNRRLHRRLTWAAVAGWIRLLLILTPIVAAIIYLPPVIKRYRCIFDATARCEPGALQSWENILKLLPLDTLQREQLKQIVK